MIYCAILMGLSQLVPKSELFYAKSENVTQHSGVSAKRCEI